MGQFAMGYEYKSGLRRTAVSVSASATWDITPDIFDMFQYWPINFLSNQAKNTRMTALLKKGVLKFSITPLLMLINHSKCSMCSSTH